MNLTTDIPFPPEIILADRFLQRMPRVGHIAEADLMTDAYWKNPKEKRLYGDYIKIALDILKKEGYINVIENKGFHNVYDAKYSLSNTGRALQDAGGYLKAYKEKKEKEGLDKQVSKAEGEKKIFDNRVKAILFLIAILAAIVGVIGLWEKYSSDSRRLKSQAQVQSSKDSTFKQVQDQSKIDSPSLLSKKKHQSRHVVSKTPAISQSQANLPHIEKKGESTSLGTKINEPIQTATSDNIEFKLTKAVGSSKAQSITLTLILTTSAANWYIMSAVKSIIDADGNEYKLKSFTNGASTYSATIDLITGIPIKCTYTFGGVLPNVKIIKLFKYDYRHEWGEPFYVEFRDISIDWK